MPHLLDSDTNITVGKFVELRIYLKTALWISTNKESHLKPFTYIVCSTCVCLQQLGRKPLTAAKSKIEQDDQELTEYSKNNRHLAETCGKRQKSSLVTVRSNIFGWVRNSAPRKLYLLPTMEVGLLYQWH